jgi:O-antigen/teichoic acid export membrane protein
MPGYLLTGLVHVVLATLLAHWMSPDGFGAFIMSYHALRLVALISSLGLGQSGIHYLPVLLRKEAYAEFRGYFRLGLLANILGPAILMGVALKLTPWITSHPAGYQQSILLPLASVLGLNLFLGGMLRGLGHPLAANLSTGAFREGLLIGFVFLLYYESGVVADHGALRALLWASLVMLASQFVFLWKNRRRLLGDAEYSPGTWLKNALPVHWLALLRLLISTAEILMVGSFLGEAAAGAFHLAMTWAGWAMIPFTSAGAIYPRTLAVATPHRIRKLMQISLVRSTKLAVAQAPFILGLALLTMKDLSPLHLLALKLLLPLYVARTATGAAVLMVANAVVRGLLRPLARVSTILVFLAILLTLYLCFYSSVLGVAVGYMVARIFSLLVYHQLIGKFIRSI